MQGSTLNLCACEGDAAPTRRCDARNAIEQSCLSRTVRTDQTNECTGGNAEADVRNCVDISIVERDAANIEQRCRCAHFGTAANSIGAAWYGVVNFSVRSGKKIGRASCRERV